MFIRSTSVSFFCFYIGGNITSLLKQPEGILFHKFVFSFLNFLS